MSFQRVHPGEWLVAASGLLVLVGLLPPFSGGDRALAEAGFLDVILVLVAVGGIILPALVARSRAPDLPIVYETALSTLVTLAVLILLLKLVCRPEGGLQEGFFLGLAGSLVMTVAGWKSVAREN